MKNYALRGLSYPVIALLILASALTAAAVKGLPAALPFIPALLIQLLPFVQARRLDEDKWTRIENARTLPVRAARALLYTTVAAALACMLFVALRSDSASNALSWVLLAIVLLQTGMLFAVSEIESKKA